MDFWSLIILSKRNALANAKIGEPVGCAGRSPALPAMSRWQYLNGFSDSIPC